MRQRGSVCLVIAAGLVVWCQITALRAQPASTQIASHPSPAPASDALAGTRSCTTAGCHGRVSPLLNERVQRDEYTIWISEDLHAQAYDKLFGDRPEKIIKNLGGNLAAYDDARCVACHANPLTAGDTATPFLREERLSGVGCEACHGEAVRWLEPHSKQKWRDESAAAKRDAGMMPPGDIAAFGRRCAGCHVGAPAQGGLPLRDVNHDLIAAGHPRLNFELSVYLANLPRHWSKKIEEQRPADFDLQIWGKGQILSALAAFDLLADRAESSTIAPQTRPWAEFAEYDCFACHHKLSSPGWRQAHDHYGSRKPGSLPWGSWYFTIPRLLAENGLHADPITSANLGAVMNEMQRPLPDRQKVRAAAAEAAGRLQDLLKSSEGKSLVFREVLLSNLKNASMATGSWDSAEQLYLGLATLPEFQRDLAAQNILKALSQELVLSFSTDPAEYGSSKNFETDRGKLLQLLKDVRNKLGK